MASSSGIEAGKQRVEGYLSARARGRGAGVLRFRWIDHAPVHVLLVPTERATTSVRCTEEELRELAGGSSLGRFLSGFLALFWLLILLLPLAALFSALCLAFATFVSDA